MSIFCFLGYHDWKENCEKCSDCGERRPYRHNWSKDCETCSICGSQWGSSYDFGTYTDNKTFLKLAKKHAEYENKKLNYAVKYPHVFMRQGGHDWTKDCEKCYKCGKKRFILHDWRNNCEKCSACGKTQFDKHNWNEDCGKCSICGTIRYGKHKWQGIPEGCSICGILGSDIVEWDPNSDTSLLFHWNKFEFEGKIIYKRIGKEIKIIFQSIYCDFTETYAPTSKRVVEKEIEGVSPFLEKFTQKEFWFMAKPQYIHDSIKSFFMEQITQIDASKLSQRDSHYLENWQKILDN